MPGLNLRNGRETAPGSATMHVTRVEEWFVEATAEEARELLLSGAGHRCGGIGECINAAVEQIGE